MTIFKKNLLTLGAAAFIFSAVLVVFAMVSMNSLYYEINIQSLGNTARTLMKAIGEDHITRMFEDGSEDVHEFFPLSANDPYRLTLIAPSGYVLRDSHVTERLVNHINREEITAALEGREGISHRESVSTNMRRIYYALPVFNAENKVIGVFRLSISIPGFITRVSPVIFSFIIFVCVFLAAVFWAVFIFSRDLSSSIRRLADIVQAGAPLLSCPQPAETSAPEFISLEKALRAMTEELYLRFEQVMAEGSRLEAILNGMSEAVFAMDAALKLHLVNPKTRELFNLGTRDVKEMTLLEATRSTELVEIAKEAISEGAAVEREITFHSGTGQYFLVYASPLAKTGGGRDADGAVLVLQEITRLVKLERIRKDFVANVSHELRTPIQLVKGFSETLLDSMSDNKTAQSEHIHFMEIIRKNAGIMENLTNDLLILASLENDGGERLSGRIYDTEDVSVLSLIKEAVFSLEAQAKKKQIEIDVKCNEELRAELYSSLIIQALVNLIDNGIKYSQANSKIWISARQENNELIFEVRDKGIGIPAEHIERIFERFYRVDKARSREAGGTGLGLSIVRHIALLHSGRAEAESHAGEGSAFRIRIPISLLQTQ